MYCHDLNDCYDQIRGYSEGNCTGYPLIVNTENYTDLQEILNRLNADRNNKCIFVSKHLFSNGLPDVQKVMSLMSKEENCVVVGLSHCMMLRGKDAVDRMLDECLGYSVKGHTVILVSHCRHYLEHYCKRDIRLENRIFFVSGEKTPLPKINLATPDNLPEGLDYLDGVGSLISYLERLNDVEVEIKKYITVATSFSPSLFRLSMYPINAFVGIYDLLTDTYSDIKNGTDKENGTDEQWSWLLSEMKSTNDFCSYLNNRFGSVTELSANLEDVFSSDNKKAKWLLWLGLKMFGDKSNEYLSIVLKNSTTYDDFEEHIYKDLLDVKSEDSLFERYYSERKQLLSRLPENLSMIRSYCQLIGRHGKNGVHYLTDMTNDEEVALMKLLDQYDWSDQELYNAIDHRFPELSLYMREFIFDSSNTKLPDKYNDFRSILTDYFRRYKLQKICNHIDDDFLSEVNSFATDRPFYKLQPRSSILSSMDRKKAQGFFFDALGVEYLSYIIAKCEQYGMIYEISIVRSELPSITIKNDDYKQYFDTKNISELDELKHHSQIYDYQKCAYPIHIFRELEIIDRQLRLIRSQLIENDSFDRAVIISDHGASRLAVIYKHESQSQIQLDEKGEHSGRCCMADEDPSIPEVAYENGFAVLGNYDRFKGGRKANLEVHGGASLEEVVIPIITLSLRPENVEYYFVDPIIKYKATKPCEIVLFSNIPMKAPKICVEGIFYNGMFQGDHKHALFSMPELKRVRDYQAYVYDGDTNTGVVLTFSIERNTKQKNLF